MKEGVPELNDAERANLGHELSDVLIYLMDLSQLCHVDLPKAVEEQFARNALKFPVAKTKENLEENEKSDETIK